MAIAHVCLGCGLDLARVRACREPHYGLWIVTCPRCQRVAPRRRHPIWRGWNSMRRIATSLAALFIQIVWVFILGVSTMALVTGDHLTWMIRRPGSMSADDWNWALASEIGVSLAGGVWVTVGLSHLDFWRRWILWSVLLYGWLALIVIDHGLSLMQSNISKVGWQEAAHITISKLDQSYRWSVPALAAILLMSVLGVPIGRMLRRGMDKWRINWARRLRRRYRMAGASA